eukprot:CAMPEP_0113952508 /NCGR_PEP_ID=MMETSP1339-20121228/90460_1 /TAXON_ID=94617 /ORGANISM="Fibrocapsa japonica" /LENGTH=379 /DNA_ID=CAMNT_0000961139 /DNA_START=75 /DNA_END=1215 /DNA_ORIENTATION=+ /assembly_acc=CAM_ASM_000762
MMNTENEFEGKDDKDFLKQLDEEYGTGEAQGPETVVVANTVPGAAAASSSNGPTIAPFVVQHQQPELSNIDIQPSATAATAMDDDRESLLGKESPEPNMWCGCLSVRFYQKYVDVDTDDVVNRLKSSVLFCKMPHCVLARTKAWRFSQVAENPESEETHQADEGETQQPPQNFLELLGDRPDAYGPFWVATTLVFFMRRGEQAEVIRALLQAPKNFLELLGDRPDAYGPFWVATTLVFFMSVATNIFQWAHHTSDSIWEYDMNAVVSIASIIYAWLVFIPLLTYIACQQLGVSISFIQLFSVYGYSLFVYVPLALLCLIPNNLVIWLCLVAAGVVSSAFLFRALSPTILNGCKDHGVKIVSAVVSANLVLTLVMKFVLF